jgi:hypothetical protein
MVCACGGPTDFPSEEAIVARARVCGTAPTLRSTKLILITVVELVIVAADFRTLHATLISSKKILGSVARLRRGATYWSHNRCNTCSLLSARNSKNLCLLQKIARLPLRFLCGRTESITKVNSWQESSDHCSEQVNYQS